MYLYHANAITPEMIDRAKTIAANPYRDYEYVGIRVQDSIPFEMGEMSHVSNVWIDGDDTGEELPGVCVIDARLAHLAVNYFGDHAAIVCGNHAEYGEDDGELIISDPVVVDILF